MHSQRTLIALKLYLLVALVGGMVVLIGPRPEPAEGAFPGVNGKIAFVTDRDGNFEIYVMNADGSGQTRLTNDPASDLGPAWSPDGTQIAFASDRDGNSEIYVMNADGSGQKRLPGDSAFDGVPAWSPDGTKITFTSLRDGNFEVYVMDADGSDQTNISDNGAQDGFSAWSPNGSKIAFATDRDGNAEIYTMNEDGTGQINVTNNPAADGRPAWSPDGSKIAFDTDRDGNSEIYTMNPDGSKQTRLPDPAIGAVPAWSPDGSQIAFTSARDDPDPSGCGALCNFEIYVMNADGSGQTNLSNSAARDLAADWQPVAATPLSSPAGEGAISLQVGWTTGFTPGDFIQINPGGANQEDNQIAAIGSFMLVSPLQFDHQEGEQVIRDKDGDGCTDVQELGPNPSLGGQRDLNSFWDFFDVPAGGLPRDGAVNSFDIGAVVLRFGAFVQPPPTESEALAQALTSPADTTSYHAAYDRGGPIPGQDLWNLLPPNGAIDGFDIGAVVVQFGHTCA